MLLSMAVNTESDPVLTPQQRHFTAVEGRFAKYRRFVSGDASLLHFLTFELYSLFLSNLGSIAGFALRSIALPRLFARCGRGLAVGKGGVVRQPNRISVGSGVILEDYVTLDVRSNEENPASIEIADNVFIGRYTIIAAKGGAVKLGRGCNISTSCRVATQSGVEIGESVLIAAYAYIGPGNHRFDGADTPFMNTGMDLKGGVKIGNNCWIGAHSTILDGVTIGEGAVVGAHAFVREDVPPRAIVVGVPARVVKIRE